MNLLHPPRLTTVHELASAANLLILAVEQLRAHYPGITLRTLIENAHEDPTHVRALLTFSVGYTVRAPPLLHGLMG